MSIPPDRAHIQGTGVAAGAPYPVRETMPIPSDYEHKPGTGGDAGDSFFIRFYVDDYFGRGKFLSRRAQVVTCHIESLASDHFRLFEPRGPRDSSLLEMHKLLGWRTRSKALGWVLDTDKLIVYLPPRKSSKLWEVLED